MDALFRSKLQIIFTLSSTGEKRIIPMLGSMRYLIILNNLHSVVSELSCVFLQQRKILKLIFHETGCNVLWSKWIDIRYSFCTLHFGVPCGDFCSALYTE